MGFDFITSTQRAMQQSVYCESLTPFEGLRNKAWIENPQPQHKGPRNKAWIETPSPQFKGPRDKAWIENP